MRDWGLPAAWAPRLLGVLRTVGALIFLGHGGPGPWSVDALRGRGRS